MKSLPHRILFASILTVASGVAAGAGMAASVTRVDAKARCVFVEWNNSTERKACWTDSTKFSVLETKKAARSSDIRVGTYLRMEGKEVAPFREELWGKEGQFIASEMVIWEAQSKPVKP
ncbi:MAG: hypothetical protein ABIT82_09950 [Ramlibacter sp.]